MCMWFVVCSQLYLNVNNLTLCCVVLQYPTLEKEGALESPPLSKGDLGGFLSDGNGQLTTINGHC